jgi:sulfopyruvate decarboxylase subunit beta
MNQRDAFETLAEHVGDELVVTAIGTQTQLWHSVLHRPGNFYLSGPMGHALTFGLGLALARPKEKVIAIEGDGGLLMNLSALAALAQHQPSNMAVIIMDNQSYELTGKQPMVNQGKSNFVKIAEGFEITETYETSTPAELSKAFRNALDAGRFSFIWARLELMSKKAPPFPYFPFEIKVQFWGHMKNL